MAAALVGVMRLLGCCFDGAWYLVVELRLLAFVCFDCRCSLSFVVSMYQAIALAVPGVWSFLRVTHIPVNMHARK